MLKPFSERETLHHLHPGAPQPKSPRAPDPLAMLSSMSFVLRRRPAAGGWRTEGDEPASSDAIDVEPPVQAEPELHVKQEPEENVTRERAVGSGI